MGLDFGSGNWYNPFSWNGGGVLGTGVGPDFSAGDAGVTLFGGPVGYAVKKGYERQQAGNEAQMQSMADARAQIEELKKKQYAQRMQDLNKAMGYFQPAQDLLNRMYGGGAGGGGGGPPDPYAAMSAGKLPPGSTSPLLRNTPVGPVGLGGPGQGDVEPGWAIAQGVSGPRKRTAADLMFSNPAKAAGRL